MSKRTKYPHYLYIGLKDNGQEQWVQASDQAKDMIEEIGEETEVALYQLVGTMKVKADVEAVPGSYKHVSSGGVEETSEEKAKRKRGEKPALTLRKPSEV